MVKHFTKSIILIFLFCSIIFPQTSEEIEQQNKRLENLRTEITQLQQSLNKLSEQEKNSLEVLQTFNQQSTLLSQLIAQLKKEERLKENEINRLSISIDELEREVEKLREDYSKYVVWLYKNRRGSFLKFLVGSESINQALIRYKYLKYITDEKEETLTNLKEKKAQLENLIAQREKKKNAKELLAAEKVKEQKTLSEKKSEREELLTTLKEDQEKLLQEIDDKRKAEIKIKNMIARLIEEE
ncbi:MAG: hypothetical protein U5K00_13455 [Melioribacteraceae bacterium]|nr:hypothetical protein [Melioribacteraceae bacterium]